MSSVPSIDDLQQTPRKVQLRFGTVIGRFLAWTFLTCVLVIGSLRGVSAINRLHRLQQSGIVINADLIGADIQHGKSDSYYLTVSFSSGSTTVEQRRMVTQQLYYEYASDHTIPVTVSPENPKDFEIGNMTDEVIVSTQTYWFWTVVGLAAFAAAITAGVETNLNGERKLLISGQAVLGTITDVQPQRQNSTSMNVTYTFETSLGQREATCFAQGAAATQNPVGSTFIVFYRPENENKSRPLPFFQMIELES